MMRAAMKDHARHDERHACVRAHTIGDPPSGPWEPRKQRSVARSLRRCARLLSELGRAASATQLVRHRPM
jgi:hypothetical protein